MANRIFYNPEGYIEVIIEGDQSYMSFLNLKADAATMLEDLQKQGKKRLGLIDVSKQGAFTVDSNKAAMEILETLNYERLAIFGTNKILEEITKAIIMAMGKTGNTKIFADRQIALAWLLSDNSPADKSTEPKTNEK